MLNRFFDTLESRTLFSGTPLTAPDPGSDTYQPAIGLQASVRQPQNSVTESLEAEHETRGGQSTTARRPGGEAVA
jgi:hypothetical protein